MVYLSPSRRRCWCVVGLVRIALPPLRIGPTASKSLREWGGTQKRRKIKNFKLANVEVNCEIAGRPF
eukprot:scaffold8108_cov118-Skeletonema_dohrnii-CCMP3373.AAC.3